MMYLKILSLVFLFPLLLSSQGSKISNLTSVDKRQVMDQLLITYNSLQIIDKEENNIWHNAWRQCKREVNDAGNTHDFVMALSRLSKTRKDHRLEVSSDLHQLGTITSKQNLNKGLNSDFPLKYAGFNKFLERQSYHAFLHRDENKSTLLIQLIELSQSLEKDFYDLLVFCDDNKLLEHNVIIDMRGTKGDTNVENFVSMLFPQPFNGLQIQVACTSMSESFFSMKALEKEKRIADLIKNSEKESILVDLPKEDVKLKSKHVFRGSIVLFLGNNGESGSDQVSCLLGDNGLGYRIGMSSAGLGYHYIHKENIKVSNGQFVQFPWPLAQIIRPNGKPLQGNPAEMDLVIEKTGNVNAYTSKLINAAMNYFSK